MCATSRFNGKKTSCSSTTHLYRIFHLGWWVSLICVMVRLYPNCQRLQRYLQNRYIFLNAIRCCEGTSSVLSESFEWQSRRRQARSVLLMGRSLHPATLIFAVHGAPGRRDRENDYIWSRVPSFLLMFHHHMCCMMSPSSFCVSYKWWRYEDMIILRRNRLAFEYESVETPELERKSCAWLLFQKRFKIIWSYHQQKVGSTGTRLDSIFYAVHKPQASGQYSNNFSPSQVLWQRLSFLLRTHLHPFLGSSLNSK